VIYFKGAFYRTPCTLANQLFRGATGLSAGARPPQAPVIRPLPTPPFFDDPVRGNPSEFLDETSHTKTIVWVKKSPIGDMTFFMFYTNG